MFSKVLIANRGAIATRVIRTLREMGVKSVAVYAEADADSLHVQLADEAYPLGEGNASTTYLDTEKLFAIIEQSGAQAVHPGYGFLSENTSFSEQCAARGVVFLGPTPDQIRQFGLKHEARALAQANAVPLVPGSDLLDDIETAVVEAQRIGYPVMLKSTAGGGGIGMQRCDDDAQLHKAFESVKRLSANNFGNSGVFLEKFIVRARHIEVQVFGDGLGHVTTFIDRDCSAQRRNQKVVEETPAPNLAPAVRIAMQATAQQLMSVVCYRSAGTVEYVYDPDSQQFFFLEVNTRLQVEHGVTEMIYGVDIVRWMIELGAGELTDLALRSATLQPNGHAIQVRVYAEDANKNFQPSAGLLAHVDFPAAGTADDGAILRIDRWIESGIEVPALFDPMLAKIIVHHKTRNQAIAALASALEKTRLYGIETNLRYLQQVMVDDVFLRGEIFTRYLNDMRYVPQTFDVINAGTMTTIQDFPGRSGYWNVGIPPSGAFDDYSFRLGNRLLCNEHNAAGLEITLNGPTLRFNKATRIALTGAEMTAQLNGEAIAFWSVISVSAGDELRIGKTKAAGARAYLLIAGGIDSADYLGSKSTFTLGQFGGLAGRALRAGDVVPFLSSRASSTAKVVSIFVPTVARPAITTQWTLHVVYGPHGAPDFFTEQDIREFFSASWQVHYNSSRTGIRLIGPKPQWARSDGGEAGLHPSNIHDNAYALGAVDFTGDMPVILGPDGPSLGGFVCPVTVIRAERWKLGQLKAGDSVRFVPVSIDSAVAYEADWHRAISALDAVRSPLQEYLPVTPVVATLEQPDVDVRVVYRAQGDRYLLVEYGELQLDMALRFRAHALMLWLQKNLLPGMLELTPGIRSLQIHYDSQCLPLKDLLSHLRNAERAIGDLESLTVPSRIVHLPLSWDDEACRLAIDKYSQSVRKNAPWCPSNIEFIRRINGLACIDEVQKIVFDASYVVMGLGDVYLGAPVATPLDPRHRLVTTKYNPARTWTAENSVGIGGSYMCVYGMEGPGGYQFVGRTLQMWNRYRTTREFTKPWLLRFFDQIRFYPVSHDELQKIRRDFPMGRFSLRIEETEFSWRDYKAFLTAHAESIGTFQRSRDLAFQQELQRWIADGQLTFDSQVETADESADQSLPDNCAGIESQVAGSVWKVLVNTGDTISVGQPVMVLESMKMEIEVNATHAGKIRKILKAEGNPVAGGSLLMIVEENA
jgi:urea carboxylase